MAAGRRSAQNVPVQSSLTLERVHRDVEVLARAGLDTATFLNEVFESLQRAVPSRAACVATVDPASQLATGAYKFGELAGRSETDELWGLLEYGHAEPTSFSALAHAGTAAVGMQAAMGRDADRSRRVRDLVRGALDCADELRIVAGGDGQLWGGVALFRDAPFAAEEVEFAARLSVLLARGLRLGLLARVATEQAATAASRQPAVMVFDTDGRLRQASAGAEARLAELVREADAPKPYAVIGSLVAAAWRYAAGDTDTLPTCRVRLRSGEWVVLHASPLSGTDGAIANVVVTVEEARPPEIVPLVVAAFDLTPRERDVTQLVLQGFDTRQIATALHLSPHTVQDHLKSIFEKTGVTARRELVARIFFDQYVPRIGSPLSPSGGFLNSTAERVVNRRG